LPIIYKIYR